MPFDGSDCKNAVRRHPSKLLFRMEFRFRILELASIDFFLLTFGFKINLTLGTLADLFDFMQNLT